MTKWLQDKIAEKKNPSTILLFGKERVTPRSSCSTKALLVEILLTNGELCSGWVNLDGIGAIDSPKCWWCSNPYQTQIISSPSTENGSEKWQAHIFAQAESRNKVALSPRRHLVAELMGNDKAVKPLVEFLQTTEIDRRGRIERKSGSGGQTAREKRICNRKGVEIGSGGQRVRKPTVAKRHVMREKKLNGKTRSER